MSKNYGIYKSINYGINKSSGDYVLVHGSDDIYNSNETISQIVKIIKKNRDIKIFLEMFHILIILIITELSVIISLKILK